jgi:hypothetical protein
LSNTIRFATLAIWISTFGAGAAEANGAALGAGGTGAGAVAAGFGSALGADVGSFPLFSVHAAHANAAAKPHFRILRMALLLLSGEGRSRGWRSRLGR